MKIMAVGVMMLSVLMACQNSTPIQAQEKSTTKEQRGTKMGIDNSVDGKPDKPKLVDWKNFKKPADSTLKKILTPLQYDVTQHEGTEPPFQNEYDKNKRDGIYVDIVSGEPLFSSKDKYESGTGWPSFTKPLEPSNIVTRTDRSFFSVRTEVRSKHGDSHLGHVFPDGPQPSGLRYCMNSASLRFIPKENLESEGYGEYKKFFEQK